MSRIIVLELLVAVLPFLVGPLLYEIFRRSKKTLDFFDSLIFMIVLVFSTIAITHLAKENNDFLIFGFAVFGIFLPGLLEKSFKQFHHLIHKVLIIGGFVGLFIHVFLESLLVPLSAEAGNSALLINIGSHRLLVGLVCWSVLLQLNNYFLSTLLLLILPTVAVIGLFLGINPENLSSTQINYLQAVLLGSVLHIAFYSHGHGRVGNAESCCNHAHNAGKSSADSGKSFLNYAGLGALVGLGLSYFFMAADTEVGQPLLKSFNGLFLISAPAVFLAFVLSGLLKAFLPSGFISWLNRGKQSLQAIKGMLFGLPLPICSCGVLPLYKTLTEKGIAPAAGIALLVATPEIGLDAILISLPFLGAELTLIRLAAAAIVAFVLAVALAKLSRRLGLKVYPLEVETAHTQTQSRTQQLNQGMKYSYFKLGADLAPWLIVGILVAAMIEANSATLLIQQQNLWLDVVLASLVGVFVYVCASGATPLVAALIAVGVSPGAAVAFLLSGPATNVSTYGILAKLHSRKFALSFIFSVMVLAIIIGLTVNQLFSLESLNIPSLASGHEHLGWVNYVSAFFVALHFMHLLYRGGSRNFFKKL